MQPGLARVSIAIFGASGFLGGHVFRYFEAHGTRVIGTFRSCQKPRLIPFTLNRHEINLEFIPANCSYAIIASGNANVDYHKVHPEECEREIDGTKLLIGALLQRGITPVYLSTDYVFEGTAGNYRETDPTRPTTSYGRNKLAIERHLKGLGDEYLIVRIGKVYGTRFEDRSVILDIVNALRTGEEARCAYDQLYSPTLIEDVVLGIAKLIETGARGIFHLSNHEVMSPYELANKIKSSIPGCGGMIRPWSIKDVNLCEERPLNTTLNSEKLSALAPFRYQSVDQSLMEIRDRYF